MNKDSSYSVVLAKIEKLEKNVNRIESKLDMLLDKFEILNDLKPQCKKMSDHIDFVENVYDKVKSPMYFILDKITQIKNITNGNMRTLENVENMENVENVENIDTSKLLEQ